MYFTRSVEHANNVIISSMILLEKKDQCYNNLVNLSTNTHLFEPLKPILDSRMIWLCPGWVNPGAMAAAGTCIKAAPTVILCLIILALGLITKISVLLPRPGLLVILGESVYHSRVTQNT